MDALNESLDRITIEDDRQQLFLIFILQEVSLVRCNEIGEDEKKIIRSIRKDAIHHKEYGLEGKNPSVEMVGGQIGEMLSRNARPLSISIQFINNRCQSLMDLPKREKENTVAALLLVVDLANLKEAHMYDLKNTKLYFEKVKGCRDVAGKELERNTMALVKALEEHCQLRDVEIGGAVFRNVCMKMKDKDIDLYKKERDEFNYLKNEVLRVAGHDKAQRNEHQPNEAHHPHFDVVYGIVGEPVLTSAAVFDAWRVEKYGQSQKAFVRSVIEHPNCTDALKRDIENASRPFCNFGQILKHIFEATKIKDPETDSPSAESGRF